MTKKISQLPVVSTPDGTEQVEVNQGGISRRITTQEIADLGSGGSSSLIDWDMSTDAFPLLGSKGQAYYGTELTTRTNLTDTAGNTLPSKLIAIALINNPTTNAHFAFINVIF